MKKTDVVLVLGASVGQLTLINLCKDMGYYVVAVTPRGRYVGIPFADEILYENVISKERIFEYAREINVVAVVSDQLDLAVPIVAYLSEKLGLRGIKPEIAELYTNKSQMRLLAQRAGVKVPSFIVANTLAEAEEKLSGNTLMRYPLMLKPVDSAASHGIHRLECHSDLSLYFEDAKNWSKTGAVIIERYVEGQEYVVEAYTHDYIPVPLAVGKRDYFHVGDTFIPRSTVFKDSLSANSDIEERLKCANTSIIKCSGLEFGITHGEYICEKDTGEIYLVEIAARGGGVQTASDIIPAACGINVEELLLKDVLGKYKESEFIIKKGAAGYFCYLLPEGEIKAICNCKEVEELPGVETAFWNNIAVGDKTDSIRDKASRKGPIIISGESVDSCYQVWEQVKQLLKIQVLTPNGMKGIIWK
jgi:carbamoyl-phosphate synthase large subunit